LSHKNRACKAGFSHHLAGSNPNHGETGMAEANSSIQQTTTTGVARLTDLPAEWSRQREMLGFPSH